MVSGRFSLFGKKGTQQCPCGWRGSGLRDCGCTPAMVDRYRGRVSGPLLDRIDIQVEVPAVTAADLARGTPGEPSPAVRERVVRARDRQAVRNRAFGGVEWNAHLRARDLRRACPLTPRAAEALDRVMIVMKLSARAHDRILKVARTIADLAGADVVDTPHVAEAASYRSLDRPAVPA